MNILSRLLSERIGLDSEAVPGAVAAAIRRRVRQAGLEDEEAYVRRLGADPEEFDRFAEELMVPETWFFRDMEPFAFLRRYVREEWHPRPGRERLKILSLPCSTGEEPYSIAIALFQAGLAPGDFQIEAVDWSERSLAFARAGLYERVSFREKAPPAPPYFVERGGRWAVSGDVLRSVNFRRVNGLDYAPSGGPVPGFDAIFCRNLLIYLTPDARRRVMERLEQQLVQGGLFFLGHAELPHVFLPSYRPVEPARAFAARKPVSGGERRA